MNFAVLFDMDGVIIDSNPYHKKAWKVFCNKYKIELPEDEMERHMFGRPNAYVLNYVFKRELPKKEMLELEEEKEALFRELFLEDIKPVEGLIPFIEKLKAQGVKTAIATAAPTSNLDYTLKHIDIRKHFDAIVDASGVKEPKPDPEIYLKAAAMVGIDPKRCVVIEDSLTGVEAGLAAGMKVIGVTTSHDAAELSHTHLVIDNFNALTPEKLDSLLSE